MGEVSKNIVGFKFHAWTMAMGPYYVLKQHDGGKGGYECITAWYDIPLCEEDKGNCNQYNLQPHGKVSRVIITKEEADAFGEALLANNLMSWDGYCESRKSTEDIVTVDYGFELEMVLEDGKKVTACGNHARPDNYSNVVKCILDFFEKHQDYSEYYPKKFPDEMINSLTITIGSTDFLPETKTFKIQLTKGFRQWAILMKDPTGTYMEEGKVISASASVTQELPFEQFIDVLKKYNMGQFNGVREGQEYDEKTEIFSAAIRYENDKEYLVSKNLDKVEFDSFIRAMIQVMLEFYQKWA